MASLSQGAEVVVDGFPAKSNRGELSLVPRFMSPLTGGGMSTANRKVVIYPPLSLVARVHRHITLVPTLFCFLSQTTFLRPMTLEEVKKQFQRLGENVRARDTPFSLSNGWKSSPPLLPFFGR